MKAFLNATEFARIIGKDPKTVIRWIEKEWIPNAKRLGKQYQIPSREVSVFQQSKIYPPKKWEQKS